jgi:hypothetical protein
MTLIDTAPSIGAQPAADNEGGMNLRASRQRGFAHYHPYYQCVILDHEGRDERNTDVGTDAC